MGPLSSEVGPVRETTTVGEMEARHKAEVKALKERAREAKKAARKEGKGKVAEVEARMLQEEMDLEAQHREELEAHLEEADEGETVVVEAPQKAEEAAREQIEKKKAKAARKRGRKIARDKEKEERQSREAAELAKTSDRTLELDALAAKLLPQGLGIHEVAADGNCLFRAVEHQLGPGGPTHADLRAQTADFMRANADDFVAFFVADDAQDPVASFEAHCDKLRDTPEWGGQPEILALSQLLQRPIWVHSRDAPTLKTGHGDHPPIHLAFHRHYFALGEHYNSVVAL